MAHLVLDGLGLKSNTLLYVVLHVIFVFTITGEYLLYTE